MGWGGGWGEEVRLKRISPFRTRHLIGSPAARRPSGTPWARVRTAVARSSPSAGRHPSTLHCPPFSPTDTPRTAPRLFACADKKDDKKAKGDKKAAKGDKADKKDKKDKGDKADKKEKKAAE